ncbi:uncharacterized protein RJT20DRAFT_135245 [Scheffersomyces xylosifermentans]|uniref:uncharacterized protein n=1 Tax=Scheffersomyces xylosifermentans TaxID=1304137 RepID=UPI00315D8AA7
MLEFLDDYVKDRDSFIKYLRLVVFVCFYLIARQYYTKYATEKLAQKQHAEDQREAALKPEKEKREKEELEEKLRKEAKTFGWGKRTRKNVKNTEATLQEAAEELRQRHQTAYDAAEDHDIEDLLEE